MNLQHQSDVLAACDQALRFKRIVKSLARAHGCDATFLAKPYRDMAGSGLHVHASLLDAGGRNLFACEEPAQCADLRHAICGMLDSLGEGMAICAPGPNSYRRFRPEAYVPMIPSWSVNNRGSAIRIPVSDAANRRIEHRLAGADANPYLVVAWMLAGIHRGLSRGARAAAARERQRLSRRGRAAARALADRRSSASRASDFAREYLGKPFSSLYATVKQGELEEFQSHVSPLEIEWYMGAL